MNYQFNDTPMMQQYITPIEPFVLEALIGIIGRRVVIETVRGNLSGILVDVKPDHIVVKAHDNEPVFFVRIQQIVYVMPD